MARQPHHSDNYGGKRKGAGRKVGSFGRKRRILEGIREDMKKADLDIIDPVNFMLAVANQDDVPLDMRVDCASKAAPYVRPRLNAHKLEAEQGDLFVELVQYTDTPAES